MARFLSVNPTYDPLSMDEMLRVPLLYDAAYKDTENRFEKLSDSMADYEMYARMYPNSEASQQYLNFVDRFNTAVDDFYNTGLRNSRVNLNRLRRDYQSVSKPFKTAVGMYNAILAQRQKDYKDGIIGPDVDFDYVLNHPEYNVDMDKKSYITGKTVYNIAKDLFKGLGGFDNTPKRSTEGGFATIKTPQSYSANDIYTAFTGEGDGIVTSELKRAVELFKQQTGYYNMPDQQDQIIAYGLQGAMANVKPDKVSTYNLPKSKDTEETPKNGGRSLSGQTGSIPQEQLNQ